MAKVKWWAAQQNRRKGMARPEDIPVQDLRAADAGIPGPKPLVPPPAGQSPARPRTQTLGPRARGAKVVGPTLLERLGNTGRKAGLDLGSPSGRVMTAVTMFGILLLLMVILVPTGPNGTGLTRWQWAGNVLTGRAAMA
ncbi:hypothetical protein [Thiomonas sp.]